MRDAALAVTLAFFTQVKLMLADGVEGPMAVAWRRSLPLLAGALAGGGLVVQTLAGQAEVVGASSPC